LAESESAVLPLDDPPFSHGVPFEKKLLIFFSDEHH